LKEINFTIGLRQKDMRIDRVIAEKIPNLSRTKIKTMIVNGNILADGKEIKPNSKFSEGVTILVSILKQKSFELSAENIPLDIIFEDDYFFAVNKPAGMVVHPGGGNPTGTLVNALLGLGKQISDDPDGVKPGIVHRLDKQTSGLILIAKTNFIHTKFSEMFANRTIRKEYVALTWGDPKWDKIVLEKSLARDPKNRKRFIVSDDGRHSETEFVVMERLGHLSVLRAFPKTGRTHQIRVHLQHLHHPIFGDETYKGGPKRCNGIIKPASDLYRRMMTEDRIGLHAMKLEFQHPVTSKPVVLELPIPEYFQHWIDHAREIYFG